jgi:peptidyl-prolyl cis-trans isomerase B (cyclophilin B)
MKTGWKTVFAWVAAAVVMAAVGLGPIQIANAQDSTKPAVGTGKTMEMQMSDSAHAAMMKAQEAKMADSTPKAAPPADTTKPASKVEEKPKTETAPADTTGSMTKAGEKPKTETAPGGTVAPASKPEEKPKTEAAPVDPKAPYKSVTFAKGEKPRVVMETTQGRIVIELWPDTAPKHCQSFVYLVNKGFYDSLTFHRIVPSFVIQGGDPKGNGTGGPGYSVPAEFSETLLHEDGILSMARAQDPNSAGSQFFICLGRLASLDKKYTIFGKVVEGLDVVHKIEKVPVQGERPVTPVVMTKVYLEKKG